MLLINSSKKHLRPGGETPGSDRSVLTPVAARHSAAADVQVPTFGAAVSSGVSESHGVLVLFGV